MQPKETTELKLDNHSILIAALEGPFGSGKTAVADEVKNRLVSKGIYTEIYKLGGLGDNQSMLKNIKSFRVDVERAGTETQQQKMDRETDRIYHLAAIRQGRTILNRLSVLPEHAVVLLDRTPFVGYAYTMALNKNNRNLETIYAQNLQVAQKIGIQGVLLFDLSIEEAYARTLARYFSQDETVVNKIHDVMQLINAPHAAARKIEKRSLELIATGVIKPREYDARHFMQYDLAQRQRETYLFAVERGRHDLGYKLKIINAEKSFLQVVQDSTECITRLGQSPANTKSK